MSIDKNPRYRSMFFKAGPIRFKQFRKRIKIKPLSQSNIFFLGGGEFKNFFSNFVVLRTLKFEKKPGTSILLSNTFHRQILDACCRILRISYKV